MRVKHALVGVALYLCWIAAGILTAMLLTFLVACIIDPHGTGPVGEGLLFVAAFAVFLPIGITLGCLRASAIWHKRCADAR